MTAWAQSLIRISNYEVETLQKRLAEITARRASAEMRIAVLDAEVEVERERARSDAEARMLLDAYVTGWKARRGAAEADVLQIGAEEAGARDALTGAFEELKKFEHVAETTRLNALVAAARKETARFDELGLRRRAG
ncbi:flagellar export protein FliJ [Brevundimonas fluminis]|jgi:flagellar protein FliJ|uniref:flagellar export protein FliJ n=1 Tax=Brevundimonas fluminis TaxID=2487274 RepID=UPI000F656A0F|nr:flagellar export protein FliJ [Brevundimonas fluminis]